MPDRVYGVVVTYHANIGHFVELLESLVPQVERVIVVDNTPGGCGSVARLIQDRISQGQQIRLHVQGTNSGIGAALNVGIRASLADGCTHVLLSDQDSVPEPGMVEALLDAERTLMRQGASVAAIGPVFQNLMVGRPFRFMVRRPWLPWYGYESPCEAKPLVSVVSLITSGSLLARSSLDVVGTMMEELFVDFVDIEWCQRAHARGLESYSCFSARMRQRMGDSSLHFWLMGWRSVSEYSPLRLYYQFRNSVYLTKLSYVDFRFKLWQPFFWLAKFYVYSLFSRCRRAAILMMLKGWWNGLIGRLGQYR